MAFGIGYVRIRLNKKTGRRREKRIVAAAEVSVMLIVAAFFIGSRVNERQNAVKRRDRCAALISFAIAKAERGDISNRDIMEALISNVYAAREYCGDPELAAQLHDIWNTLIFRSDEYITRQDVLTERLENLSKALMAGK